MSELQALRDEIAAEAGADIRSFRIVVTDIEGVVIESATIAVNLYPDDNIAAQVVNEAWVVCPFGKWR